MNGTDWKKLQKKVIFSHFSLDCLCLLLYTLLRKHAVGGIAKWPKATVCKIVIRGFKSHSRLDNEG